MFAAIGAFFTGNRVVILTLAASAVILAILWYFHEGRNADRAAGAAAVSTAVQGEAIKRSEAARQDRVRVEDAVRAKPIEAVIDEDLK